MKTESSTPQELVDLAHFYLVDALDHMAVAVTADSRASQLTHLDAALPATQETEQHSLSIADDEWGRFVRTLVTEGAAQATVRVATLAGGINADKVEPTPNDAGYSMADETELRAENVELDPTASQPQQWEIAATVEAADGDWEAIELLEGANRVYLFSEKVMTRAYARWSFLAEEGDDLATFAACVREESQLYPRPMALESLQNAPFRMDAAHIEELFERAQAEEGMGDLRRCEASNGDVYYYSADFLSDVRARSLAERRSVIIPNNP